MFKLRPADISEHALLSGLCMRSKAVWGYDSSFLEACRVELTVTPEMLVSEAIATSPVMVAERTGASVGVAQIALSGEICDLVRLFVDPTAMGTGVGRALFDWAKQAARDAGCRSLIIDSDPGAVAFYRAMGTQGAGDVASGSIPGRRIPRLVLNLA